MLYTKPNVHDPRLVRILGVEVTDLKEEGALSLVHGTIEADGYLPIAFLNAHSSNVALTDSEFRGTLRNFTVLSDGIGVDIAAALLKGAAFRANLNGTDFVPNVLATAPSSLRIALWGAKPGVAEKAVEAFRKISNSHDYRVVAHGYVSEEEEKAALEELEKFRPHILLVAMGVPLQEKWIASNIRVEHANVVMAVGALFDIVSGDIPRAPVWMRKLRLEWIHRLVQEPRRLWRRYVVGNPLFLIRVLGQVLGPRGKDTADA